MSVSPTGAGHSPSAVYCFRVVCWGSRHPSPTSFFLVPGRSVASGTHTIERKQQAKTLLLLSLTGPAPATLAASSAGFSLTRFPVGPSLPAFTLL